MKAITTLVLVFGLFYDNPPELGLGIVTVDIDTTTEIKIFRNRGDNAPEKIIRLIRKDGAISIEESGYSKWLKPETIWLDYYQFLFRYTATSENWIEIITNNETGNKGWILKTETLNVQTWETFLVENTTAIEPLSPTDIKSEPNAASRTIRRSTTEDCFEAIEVRGDWMKIKTNETLECSEHKLPIKSGWIKWKQNNRLLIAYFLTC